MTKYEEGVRDLEQLEDLLYRWERDRDTEHLALGRICYFLLERWVREHDPAIRELVDGAKEYLEKNYHGKDDI